MCIFLEKVMLDFPHVVDAESVGQLDLVKRVLKQFQFLARRPGTRQLMLIEGAEFHDAGMLLLEICCYGRVFAPSTNSVRSTISMTSRLRCSMDFGSNRLTFHSRFTTAAVVK